MVQFASYARRVLHKTRLIFSRMNGPNIIETQHRIIKTQHNIIETQHCRIETQHNVIETQHSIIQTQHNATSTHNSVFAKHNAKLPKHNTIFAKHNSKCSRLRNAGCYYTNNLVPRVLSLLGKTGWRSKHQSRLPPLRQMLYVD